MGELIRELSIVQELIAKETAARETITQELIANAKAAGDGKSKQLFDRLDLESRMAATFYASIEQRVSCLEQFVDDSTDGHQSILRRNASSGEAVEAGRKELTALEQLRATDQAITRWKNVSRQWVGSNMASPTSALQ